MGGFARESCFLIREESTESRLIREEAAELCTQSADRSTQTTDFDAEEEDGEEGVPRGSTSARSRFKTFVKSRSKKVFESFRTRSCSFRLPGLLEGPRRRPWESELAYSARAFRGQGMWRDLRRRVKNLFYL